MNRTEINAMSAAWITQATNDLVNKLNALANESGINPLSLSLLLTISKDRLSSILKCETVPTMEEFVKIMILTGNALSIEPLNEEVPPMSPPCPPMPHDFHHCRDNACNCHHDTHEEEEKKQYEEKKSPFASMPRERLVNIIVKKLWDTEINIEEASNEELVEFLNKKDKRIREMKEIENAEKNPEFMRFVNGLKTLVKNDPKVKDAVEKLVRSF